MRLLLWHGYLLAGTGSNVYTRSLARAWSRAGHEVVVVSQEPHPHRYDLGGARVVRPALEGPLPVFVLDRYEDARPALLTEMSVADRDRFVEQNAAALRELGGADLLVTNHVLLGGPVGAAVALPYVVKAHGSELEFAIRGNDDLASWAHRSLAGAAAVIAGSDHVARVLDELVEPRAGSVHVVPPGVDIDALRPRPRDEAFAGLLATCRADAPNPPGPAHDERAPDDGNESRLASFLADPRPTVLYVGKLSAEKGVAVLLEALRTVDAKAVVVGFGPARAELEELAGPGVLFTGPMEHRHLAHLWPLCDVAVTPSVFPEAFGMVAAEAAACGCPPLVARHSGLAEVAAGLSEHYPGRLAHLSSFESGSAPALSARLAELLALSPSDRRAVSEGARRSAETLWSWESVARRVLLASGSATG